MQRREDTDTAGEGPPKRKSEIGAMEPQGKEATSHQKVAEGGKDCPLERGDSGPASTSIEDCVREYTFVVYSSHGFCGNLSPQPQENNILMYRVGTRRVR